MRYYTTWQEALQEFLQRYGENYKDSYNLMMEFEEQLHRNIRGTYFMRPKK